MRLIVNGEGKTIEGVSTLASLVELLGLKSDRLAIERNREIVPRADWAATLLTEDDRLEIVHFVGGGKVEVLRRFSLDARAF
jgi:thiamine biosynthesis protein ThiS